MSALSKISDLPFLDSVLIDDIQYRLISECLLLFSLTSKLVYIL